MPSEPMTERRQIVTPPKPGARRVAFGAGALGASNILKMMLQLIALPIMARLLGPAQFGLYGLAIPVVAFVGMLADGGLGISLVKEPDSSPIWATAFWALLGIGVFLAAGLTATGFVLSALLDQPRLPAIMATLSLTTILMTVTAPALARLDREGRLAVGAGADLAGNILGVCVGISLAFSGAGAWSLVGQYVTVYVVRALLVNRAAFRMPAFEFRPSLLASHFAAGGLVVGVRMSDFGGRLLENLRVGQALGTTSLGLYSFSHQIPRFACEAFGNPLWLSLYIRALRGDGAEVSRLHQQFSRILGVVLFPAASVFIVTAPFLVPAFLGEKWINAIPLMQILFPGHILLALGSQNGAVLLARNRYDVQLYCTLGLSCGRLAGVALVPWIGLKGVVFWVTGAHLIYAVVLTLTAARICGGDPMLGLRGLLRPLVASLVAGLVGWMLMPIRDCTLDYGIFTIAAAVVTYAVMMVLIDWDYLASDMNALRSIIAPRGSLRGSEAS